MKFQNSSMHVSKVMLCIKKRDDRKDERPRSNMPLQLLQSWGHKNIINLKSAGFAQGVLKDYYPKHSSRYRIYHMYSDRQA